MQIMKVEPTRGLRACCRLRGEHCIPNLGSGSVLYAKLPEFELTLSDPMHEFDAGDCRRRSAKALEAERRTKPKLDRSVILLNQIVEVFGRPDLALSSGGMFVENLVGRAMRSLITVESDLVGQFALTPERPPEEALGLSEILCSGP